MSLHAVIDSKVVREASYVRIVFTLGERIKLGLKDLPAAAVI